MKIEHKLPPHVAQYAKAALQQLNDIREQHLMLLGQVKELEQQAAVVRGGLQGQIALVQQSEGLPQGTYVFSPDGSMIVAEVPDGAAAAGTIAADAVTAGTIAAAAGQQLVNGQEVHHHA